MKFKFKKDKTVAVENNTPENTYGVKPVSGETSSSPQNTGFAQPIQNQTQTSASQPVHEEFVYTPKPQFKFGKILKLLLPIFLVAILAVPLYFLADKLNLLSPKPSGTKGELVWWGVGIEEEVAQYMIDKYVGENPKTSIKYIKQSETDYGQRLRNSIDQGVGSDIFSFHNSWVPMFKDDLDVVPETVYTRNEYASVYYPVVLRYSSTSDGIMGIPLEYDAITLYMNEDIFSQAGVSAPRTWDQFREIAKELTTKGEKSFVVQSGAAMGISENVDYWPEIIGLLMNQNKAEILRPSDETAPEAITFYTDFYVKDKVWDESLPNSIQAFAEGKVAMIIAPLKAYQQIISLNPNLRFRTTTLPQVRRDDPNEPEASYASYWLQGVSKASVNRELAWDFLKFLSEKDSLLAMNQKRAELGIPPKAYPRVDMRDLIINDRYLGSVIALAPTADSGYLAYNTQDGPDGVNTLLGNVYQGGLVSLTTASRNSNISAVIKKMSTEVAKVVFKYGLR